LQSEQNDSNSSQNGFLQIANFPAGSTKNKYSSHFVNVERRSPSNTVFHIDDNTYTSSMPRPSHWSIAWSDLMMTMFVLFLSMFTYQMANQEFLNKNKPEVIGGDTTEALQTLDSSGASFPFAPIHPGLPLITGGTVKKVERVEIDAVDPEDPFQLESTSSQEKKAAEENLKQISEKIAPIKPDKIALLVEPEKDIIPPVLSPAPPSPSTNIVEPRPLTLEEPLPPSIDNFQEIYTMSKGALEINNLSKFAAIDIVPDKTMRIILTGDLLFDLGETELSEVAKNSLEKITAVIQHTPYMINIVGHTDNVPMRSNKFKSNWELSLARASTVARFLIDDTGMNPNQFVVSGYSSYRPIAPNTTAENRAENRRVEIIISKRLPRPSPATTENLN
jgi:chemotaxis protein MotB